MEQSLLNLANQIISLHKNNPNPTSRILVSIAGVPGSGKSTLAYPLVDKINTLLSSTNSTVLHQTRINEIEMIVDPSSSSSFIEVKNENDEKGWNERVAVCIGLDGWHYSREELNLFPDPIEARRTRGAPNTFNSTSYKSFIKSLRLPPSPSSSIPFPTFSHSLKDPQISLYSILPSHKIIIIEGLYTLLNIKDWIEISLEMNLKIFIECSRAVARERLIKRHLREGVEREVEAAEERVDKSDMLNGELIRNHMVTPDIIIESIEEF